MSSRKKSLGKKINPTYYIFCEGDTEVEYMTHLKHHYRIPIEIKTKIEGNNISERKIKAFLKDRPISNKDKIFLLYDADLEAVLNNLMKVKNAILLVSNPCIELWFLIHFNEQMANISTEACIKKMNENWKEYKKGYLNARYKLELIEFQDKALERAEKLIPYNNPSTSIPEIIKLLEKQSKNKRSFPQSN